MTPWHSLLADLKSWQRDMHFFLVFPCLSSPFCPWVPPNLPFFSSPMPHETGAEHRSKNHCEKATSPQVLLVLHSMRLPENGVKRVASKTDTGFGLWLWGFPLLTDTTIYIIIHSFVVSDRKPTLHIGCVVWTLSWSLVDTFHIAQLFERSPPEMLLFSIHVNLLTTALQTASIEMKLELKLCMSTTWYVDLLQRWSMLIPQTGNQCYSRFCYFWSKWSKSLLEIEMFKWFKTAIVSQ